MNAWNHLYTYYFWTPESGVNPAPIMKDADGI